MRPAFTSSTKRRGAMALAPTLRLFFLTASDMWHLYCGLARTRAALDRDRAANTCHDIEWDDRRWNGCACSSYGAGLVLFRALTIFARNRPARCGRAQVEQMTSDSKVRSATLCPHTFSVDDRRPHQFRTRNDLAKMRRWQSLGRGCIWRLNSAISHSITAHYAN